MEKLRKHKKLALIIFLPLFLSGLLLFYFFNRRSPESTPTNPPVVVEPKSFKIVAVNPPEGDRQDFDMFSATAVAFSASVDPNTVDYSVRPPAQLEFKVYSSDPTTLWIMPKVPWVEGVRYTITLKNVQSLEGTSLKEPLVYTFSNIIPEVVEGGDPY